mmetsp:Transcript_2788/g.7728  ORF Transcript_2788/g.7728 Transcript_2788/m.7728 type:complete len:213 (+) Transcript_2788:51-689(+)
MMLCRSGSGRESRPLEASPAPGELHPGPAPATMVFTASWKLSGNRRWVSVVHWCSRPRDSSFSLVETKSVPLGLTARPVIRRRGRCGAGYPALGTPSLRGRCRAWWASLLLLPTSARCTQLLSSAQASTCGSHGMNCNAKHGRWLTSSYLATRAPEATCHTYTARSESEDTASRVESLFQAQYWHPGSTTSIPMNVLGAAAENVRLFEPSTA